MNKLIHQTPSEPLPFACDPVTTYGKLRQLQTYLRDPTSERIVVVHGALNSNLKPELC
jgi:hypothetical protein